MNKKKNFFTYLMECATRINFHVEESEDIMLYQLHEGNVYGVQEKNGKCVAQMWIFSSLLVYKQDIT